VLLDVGVDGDVALPRYLTRRDETWVRMLADVVEACVGRTRAEAERRIEDARLPGASWRQRQAASRLLLRSHGVGLRAPRDPTRVREVVFDLAASSPAATRGEILAAAAARLAVDPQAIESSLYADLPEARIVEPAKAVVSPSELVERYNLALLQGVLFHAEELRVRVRGGVRQVVSFARLQRLLVEIHDVAGDPGEIGLTISGPLSLLRRTMKYGHAMARWLPALTRLAPWSLEARCRLGDANVMLRASHADPIGTTHALPRRFDSRVEERLFRDFAKLRSGWEILREASPVQIDGKIACADFTLVDASRGLSVPVEIIGFWTPAYVQAKQDLIARLPSNASWILCVDVDLAVGDERAAWGPNAFLYRDRVPAGDFLAHLERFAASR
jgi:predicted nuclease of restriction endonuclease-like RecB superfamily